MKIKILSLFSIIFYFYTLQAGGNHENQLFQFTTNGTNATIIGLTAAYGQQYKSINIDIPSRISPSNSDVVYTVTGISSGAFAENKKIKSVTLPDASTFTSIGKEAFANCSNLDSVVIPKGILNITNNQFSGCNVTKLRVNSTNMPSNDGISVVNWASIFSNVTKLYVDKLDRVGGYFYSRPNSSDKLEIFLKDGVILNNKAFYGNKNVVVHGSPGTVNTNAFGTDASDCQVSIDFSGMKSISKSAFSNCSQASNNGVIDLSNATSLGVNCLKGCNKSSYVTMHIMNLDPVTLNYLNNAKVDSLIVHYDNYLTKNYPDNQNFQAFFPNTTIFSFEGDAVPVNVLYGHEKIKTLYLNVNSIPDHAFSNCPALETINDTKTKTLDAAFHDCTNLKNVQFNSVETMNGYCFKGCTSLETVEMHSLKTMTKGEFEGCTNLKYVEMAYLTTIGERSFYDCVNFDHEGKYAFGSFASLETIGDYAFYNCKKLTVRSFLSSTNIKTIGKYAFYGNQAMSNLCTILGGDQSQKERPVTSIGEGAFANTNIVRVFLPSTLTSIGDGAFTNLNYLVVNCPELISKESSKSFFKKASMVNNGTATLKVGGDNTVGESNCHDIKTGFFMEWEDLHLKLLVVGDNIGNIYSKGFYRIVADSVSIGKNVDLACSAGDVQMKCLGTVSINSAKLFANNSKKVFNATNNLSGVFGEKVRKIDATGSLHVFLTTPNPTFVCSPYAFCSKWKNPELRSVTGCWYSIGKNAFAGNTRLEHFNNFPADGDINFTGTYKVGDQAFANCNLPYFKTKVEVSIGNEAFLNNPMYAIVINNDKSEVAEDAFKGCTAHMVLDMSDQVVVDTNKENVKYLTKTEKRAKELKSSPYSITHVCSLNRMNHTAEDVNLDGSLSGEDVQAIYNAMK